MTFAFRLLLIVSVFLALFVALLMTSSYHPAHGATLKDSVDLKSQEIPVLKTWVTPADQGPQVSWQVGTPGHIPFPDPRLVATGEDIHTAVFALSPTVQTWRGRKPHCEVPLPASVWLFASALTALLVTSRVAGSGARGVV